MTTETNLKFATFDQFQIQGPLDLVLDSTAFFLGHWPHLFLLLFLVILLRFYSRKNIKIPIVGHKDQCATDFATLKNTISNAADNATKCCIFDNYESFNLVFEHFLHIKHTLQIQI